MRSSSLPADSQSQFLLCTFSIAAKLVIADSEVTESEKATLVKYMREELSLSDKEEKLAWRVFEDALSNDLEVRDYVEAFRKYFPDRVQLTDQVVVTLLRLASSDGYVHPNEEKEIRTVALMLGISAPAYDLLKKEHLSTEEQYH